MIMKSMKGTPHTCHLCEAGELQAERASACAGVDSDGILTDCRSDQRAAYICYVRVSASVQASNEGEFTSHINASEIQRHPRLRPQPLVYCNILIGIDGFDTSDDTANGAAGQSEDVLERCSVSNSGTQIV